jgi:hypothetical protein
MLDYKFIREVCDKNSEMSQMVIDEFLLYYAARQDGFAREFEKRMDKFRHLLVELKKEYFRMLHAQYIAHRIFRNGGTITKYLKHAAIKERDPEEQKYLQKQATVPWRFLFGTIVANPAEDFYEMEDAFTGETFLIFSTATTTTLKERPVLLWFNLVGFNGFCWQTFGPVVGYRSFNEDDIFYFATELNERIQSDEDLLAELERNPVPFMMLMMKADIPLIESRGSEILHLSSLEETKKFDMQALKKDFMIEFAENAFRLTHPEWSQPPMNAEVYYDELSETLLLTANTDKAYEETATILRTHGYNLPEDPQVRVHFSMFSAIEVILKKKAGLNPYASQFETAPSPEEVQTIEGLNRFLALALPHINNGTSPDIETLAREAGVDPELAADIFKKTSHKWGRKG